MKITLNGAELDPSVEHELFFDGFGVNAYITFNNTHPWYTEGQVRYNCTEVHISYNKGVQEDWCWMNPIEGGARKTEHPDENSFKYFYQGESSAFESDLHSNGGTIYNRYIETIELITATKLEHDYVEELHVHQ